MAGQRVGSSVSSKIRNFVLAAALLGAGCQSLILQDEDSDETTAWKVVGRTVLGISTIGISEIWYARKRALDSWLGHHINEAVAQWGPPSQVNEGYNGMRFFTWYSTSQYTTPGQAQVHCDNAGNCYSTATPATVNTIQHRTTFTVDSAGRIVAYSAN
jgi:hypothetical protein